MSTNRLFMDMHAIQVLPPSNVNRDDTGSPKTAVYGGVTRARVSSQAWKRAIREYFRNNEEIRDLGSRTLNPARFVAEKMQAEHPEVNTEDALNKSLKALMTAGLKFSKNKDGEQVLKALFFLGSRQAKELAEVAYKGDYDEKRVKAILQSNPDIDIALFGRMLADDNQFNVDASSQVAHAISTHEVNTEYDYFTAADDLQKEGKSGAAMLDTTEFNSSTLYRYANVAVHEFKHQMNDNKEAVIKGLKLYAEAFSNSMPSGKSNSFANQTLPQAFLVILRDDRPVNLVGAFENPVKAGKEGYVKESVSRMFAEADRVTKFVHKPLAAFYVLADNEHYSFDGNSEDNLDQLLDAVSAELEKDL